MNEMYNLGKKLFPICRSITGQGTLKTLKIIKNEIPNLKIKSIKSKKMINKYNIMKRNTLEYIAANEKAIMFEINKRK